MKDRSNKRRRGSFEYRESDPKDQKRASSGSGSFDGPTKSEFRNFKPAEGKNRIRILPRTWDDESGPRHWGYEVYIHYGVGADNAAYLCLQKMKGERCPICVERNQLANDGDEEAAKSPRANKSILCWIIDRKNESEGPLIWKMPTTKVHNEICLRSDDTETGEMLKVDHPDKGFDISFTKEGSRKNTSYSGVAIARKSSPLAEDDRDADEWLAFIQDNPIPDCLQFYDADYLEKVLGGQVSKKDRDEDEDEEDDEKPRRSRRSKDADDEEDDEPPPRSKRRIRDDDEDDEDDGPAE